MSLMALGAGTGLGVRAADAQSTAPGAGLASARARLLGATGVLAVAPGSRTELYAGALSAAEIPEVLALAQECTALPARTEIILTASLGDAPVQVKIERDKKGRLEVQVRRIPFTGRARLFEVAGSFRSRGAFDVRVEGAVAGKHVQALFGRIVAGDFVAGASSTSMSLVLRREGSVLRGTATGSRDVPITNEFIKDGP
jgi:hypothetical protein